MSAIATCWLWMLPLILLMTGGPGRHPSSSVPTSWQAEGSTGSDRVFQTGEELIYNVSYASFDIGQVRITMEAESLLDGKKIYRAVAHIDSYKGIPFVDLHAVYRTTISGDIHSLNFRSRTKKDAQWQQFDYNFDYPAHRISIQHFPYGSTNVDKRDTLRADTVYQDGLSLFYFARTKLHSQRTFKIPTLVSEAKGTTTIEFRGDSVHEEIDAVKYPIDLVHFEGEAGFVGIFGLTGGFEGSFSNDDACVPVVAKMKVLIGSVRIELMKWRRIGWEPPRAQENRR